MRRAWRVFAIVLTGLIAMTTQLIATTDTHRDARDVGPSGASSAFTSNDALIALARQRVSEGRFGEAEQMLRDDGRKLRPKAGEMLDIIGRIRAAYDLDAAGLLARVRDVIPDATADDLERWRQAGQLQYRSIDGRIAYFGREPANLLRFCEEAKRRRRTSPSPPPGWNLEKHLARVIATSSREKKAEVVPIRHRVRYRLSIPGGAPYVKPGAMVRAWLPFPQECERQRSVRLISSSPQHTSIARNGAVAEGAAQRTIYFEQRVAEESGPMLFEEVFEFRSSAYYPTLDDVQARPLPADWAGGNLAERPPHILFTPQLRKTVSEVVVDETNPLIKARRIFHFVAEKIAYCAEEEYSTIPSLSDKALASGQGDCGVQGMLFITMCRAAGIPARWQSGWQTKRENCDMHDWAEFYVDPWGWLPADPSYGLRESDDQRVREFYFGHQDSYRLIVNRDYGYPLFPPKHTFRSEPLDFQRGEVEIDGHNLYFPHWKYDINVEWLDEGP